MFENTQKLEHLAVIMDGNRRWAKLNRKSVKEGHEVGGERLSDLMEWCIDFEIKYLTVYAFSLDNWKRDIDEINDIMSLLIDFLNRKMDKLNSNGIRIKIIGVNDRLSEEIVRKIKKVENDTKANNKLIVNIAFNYTGRREIIDVAKIVAKNFKNDLIRLEDIDEKLFSNNLYYGGNVPDPDLVIRTSGEYRISNFLLWEIANSELFFTDVYWPDFSKVLLEEIINNFKKRERRYGGTIKR